MTDTDKANGNELPASRQAAVEQGLAMFQETAAERDALREQVRQMQSQIAAFKVALEAKDAQAADLESRVSTMMLVRDESVARRVELATVLEAMLALGRAFEIQNGPLVRKRDDSDEVAAIGGA